METKEEATLLVCFTSGLRFGVSNEIYRSRTTSDKTMLTFIYINFNMIVNKFLKKPY